MDKIGIDVPGILYSLLLAGAGLAIEYFTTGFGAGLPWATIALAVIPVIVKAITVQLKPEGEPLPAADIKGSTRSIPALGATGKPLIVVAKRSKWQKFLRGG